MFVQKNDVTRIICCLEEYRQPLKKKHDRFSYIIATMKIFELKVLFSQPRPSHTFLQGGGGAFRQLEGDQ